MEKKELEAIGCKTFACPNLGAIDEKGKELVLRDKTIKKAKDLTTEYLKKTYHNPHYSSITYLLPSFVYIATIVEKDPIYKRRIIDVFGSTDPTINKWNKDIIQTLNIQDDIDRAISESNNPEKPNEFVCPDFSILDENGKILGLKDETIAKAKELGIRYFRATYQMNLRNNEDVFPTLIYIAAIIENDKRISQEHIENIFGVKKYSITRSISDIIKVLGMKAKRDNRNAIVSISELSEPLKLSDDEQINFIKLVEARMQVVKDSIPHIDNANEARSFVMGSVETLTFLAEKLLPKNVYNDIEYYINSEIKIIDKMIAIRI
jgi:transcription initiation factor TFIIIB Brf1 subunit/transcription initiation factor TFIIB